MPSDIVASMRARAAERGFTLLELAVAIVILATLVGTLVPAVQSARVESNAAAAAVTLSQIRHAQAVFRDEDRDGDGVADYASSLRELVDAGLLPADLVDGQRQGYAFAATLSSSSVSGYVYRATPLNQGQTGVRGFAGDTNGTLPYDCAPGQQWQLERGQPTCASSPGSAVRLPLGELSGLAAIDAASLLGDGAALDLARTLLTPDLVDLVRLEFDANDDGLIEVSELLEADLLAMARRLAAGRGASGGPLRLGDDGTLDAILRRSQERLRQELSLSPGETPSRAAVACVAGHPGTLLELASGQPTHASLTVLLDLVHGLDPAPEAGQMTSDHETNLRRRRRLIEGAEESFALWGSGHLAQLRRWLLDLRVRADGNPSPGDWVAGEAARLMVARVDATLAYIEQDAD